jgi:biotin carboxyl carrier protein
MSLEFGFLMMLIGTLFVFSSLAVISAVTVALKRLLRAEAPVQTEVHTAPARTEMPEAIDEAMAFKIDLEGKTHSLKIEDTSATRKEAGKSVTLPKFKGEAKVAIDGQELTAKIEAFQVKRIPIAKELETAVKPMLDIGYVKAPMHGSVAKIEVKVGDRVEIGSPIVILEAMKMESAIESPFIGVVEEIRVSEGDTVESGEILAVITTTKLQRKGRNG